MMRCGLCDLDFDSVEESDRHFASPEHRDAVEAVRRACGGSFSALAGTPLCGGAVVPRRRVARTLRRLAQGALAARRDSDPEPGGPAHDDD